jgi:hypothetical protein
MISKIRADPPITMVQNTSAQRKTNETVERRLGRTIIQNGNALADRINVERSLVNLCVNVTINGQIKVAPPQEETCQHCFSILCRQVISSLLSNVDQILDTLQIDLDKYSCRPLWISRDISTMTPQEKWVLLNTTLTSEGVSQENEDIILSCLEGLGFIVESV